MYFFSQLGGRKRKFLLPSNSTLWFCFVIIRNQSIIVKLLASNNYQDWCVNVYIKGCSNSNCPSPRAGLKLWFQHWNDSRSHLFYLSLCINFCSQQYGMILQLKSHHRVKSWVSLNRPIFFRCMIRIWFSIRACFGDCHFKPFSPVKNPPPIRGKMSFFGFNMAEIDRMTISCSNQSPTFILFATQYIEYARKIATRSHKVNVKPGKWNFISASVRSSVTYLCDIFINSWLTNFYSRWAWSWMKIPIMILLFSFKIWRNVFFEKVLLFVKWIFIWYMGQSNWNAPRKRLPQIFQILFINMLMNDL